MPAQRAARPVEFCGTALDDSRAFPLDVRREAGYQLDRVQHGLQPDDWQPMATVGPGVQEIRVRDSSGAYRVIYVAKFSDAVYVPEEVTEDIAGRHSARHRALRRGAKATTQVAA